MSLGIVSVKDEGKPSGWSAECKQLPSENRNQLVSQKMVKLCFLWIPFHISNFHNLDTTYHAVFRPNLTVPIIHSTLCWGKVGQCFSEHVYVCGDKLWSLCSFTCYPGPCFSSCLADMFRRGCVYVLFLAKKRMEIWSFFTSIWDLGASRVLDYTG